MKGAVPPSDHDAQDSIISSVFLSEGGRSVIERVVAIGLEPKHFFGSAYQLIWEAILRCEADNLELGIVEVTADLRDRGRLDQVGGTPFLVRFATLPYELTRVEGHARRLIDLWKLREAIAFQQLSIARMYYPQGTKSQDLLEAAEEKFFELAHENRESSYESAAIVGSRALNAMADALREGKNILGTPTGFVDLDKETGGYGEGQLIIFAARPGMGKTAAAVSSLLELTKPKSDGTLPDAAYFHSCEMPREEVALRMVCSLSGVTFQKIKLNRLSRQDWELLFKACEELARRPLYIDDRPAISLLEFRSNIRKLKREIERDHQSGRPRASALKVAAIDYLQLMTGIGATRELEVSSLSRGLKEIAKIDKIAIMALSQLNRAAEIRAPSKGRAGREAGKRPQMSDLRETGAIENDADLIIFIYRAKYYDPEADDEAEFIVAKQRSGPTCTVFVVFQEETTTFRSKAKGYEEFNDYGEDGRQLGAGGWSAPTGQFTSEPEEEEFP
jgi:replicative DNA helicase